MKLFIKKCKEFVLKERSPHRLALAFCLGNFIAFSPFIGLHTIMVFFCSWAFGLSLPIMLTVSMTINNIWTLVPIYAGDYIFGYWLSHTYLKLDFTFLNRLLINFIALTPAFIFGYIHKTIIYTKDFFNQSLGLPKPCLWSFLIGGNLLGLVTSLILYPIIKKLFTRLITEIEPTNAL